MWLYHPKIRLCAQHIHRGGVVAYPTEAVWGLGCDPFNHEALAQVLTLKSRSAGKGLILVASDISQFDFLLHDLAPKQREALSQTWPGHVTWLVPHQNRVPLMAHGQHDSIALRVSNHPVVRAICDWVGGPIVSTSANPQGFPPAKTQMAARRYFGRQSHRSEIKNSVICGSDVVFSPGKVGRASKPSEIRDLETGRVIRTS